MGVRTDPAYLLFRDAVFDGVFFTGGPPGISFDFCHQQHRRTARHPVRPRGHTALQDVCVRSWSEEERKRVTHPCFQAKRVRGRSQTCSEGWTVPAPHMHLRRASSYFT